MSVGPVRAGLELAEESELLSRLRAGDPSAFESLICKYGPRMRASALRLLKNEEDADDVLQDAFVSALRSLGSFEGKSHVETWLHRIAINAALMKLRSRRQAPEQELDEELLPRFARTGAFAEPQRPWSEIPDEPALRDELCREVRRRIDELPEKYRIPLILRDIEELSNDQVAEALNVSVNAARIRIHRARQALRTLIAPYFAPPE